MSFESLICLIPLALAYLSFSVWMYEKDYKGKSDWTLMMITVICVIVGTGLLIYV